MVALATVEIVFWWAVKDQSVAFKTTFYCSYSCTTAYDVVLLRNNRRRILNHGFAQFVMYSW